MSLVFERALQGPGLHAIVIGCGRFPRYDPTGGSDRLATVAGAREIARYLINNRDAFETPLKTVEVLLSDPGVNPASGADQLGLGPIPHDPRADDAVEPAARRPTEDAIARWLGRCDGNAGDQMFFYMSSHGVADRDMSAVGLLEDVGAGRYARWAASVNVSQLAQDLPMTGASACWVFLDACQQVIQDVLNIARGIAGVTTIQPDAIDRMNYPLRTASLAGSRYGDFALAPNAPEPPYFTKALLKALDLCGEPAPGQKWVVTGKQIINAIHAIAEVANAYSGLKTEPMNVFNDDVVLIKRDHQADVPVLVRTDPHTIMGSALGVMATSASGVQYTKNGNALDWRFTVPATQELHTVNITLPPTAPACAPVTFTATPPVQDVKVVP